MRVSPSWPWNAKPDLGPGDPQRISHLAEAGTQQGAHRMKRKGIILKRQLGRASCHVQLRCQLGWRRGKDAPKAHEKTPLSKLGADRLGYICIYIYIYSSMTLAEGICLSHAARESASMPGPELSSTCFEMCKAPTHNLGQPASERILKESKHPLR